MCYLLNCISALEQKLVGEFWFVYMNQLRIDSTIHVQKYV